MTDYVVAVDQYTMTGAPYFDALPIRGVGGVIAKASEGSWYVDPTYPRHRDMTLARGLKFGAMHTMNGTDPKAQAQHFIEQINSAPEILVAVELSLNVDFVPALHQVLEFMRVVDSASPYWNCVVFTDLDYCQLNLAPNKGQANPANRLDGYRRMLARHRLWISDETQVPEPWESAFLRKVKIINHNDALFGERSLYECADLGAWSGV